jgi:hypothetical protein
MNGLEGDGCGATKSQALRRYVEGKDKTRVCIWVCDAKRAGRKVQASDGRSVVVVVLLAGEW